MGLLEKRVSFCFQGNEKKKVSEYAIASWSKFTRKSYILKHGTTSDKQYVEDKGSVKTLKFARRKRKLFEHVKFRKRQQTRIAKMSSSDNAETVEGAVSVMIDDRSNNRNKGEDNIYSVTFHSEKSGFTLDAHMEGNAFFPTTIRTVTNVDHQNKIQIGDELVAVGNTPTGVRSLVENTELIRSSTERPLTLQFKRVNNVAV